MNPKVVCAKWGCSRIVQGHGKRPGKCLTTPGMAFFQNLGTNKSWFLHRLAPADEPSRTRAAPRPWASSPAHFHGTGRIPLPAFCSKMGAVARGTVLMSKGFSEGSRVYCCRAFSIPGTETVSPAQEKGRKIQFLRAGTAPGIVDTKETQNRQSRNKKAALKMRQSCQV